MLWEVREEEARRRWRRRRYSMLVCRGHSGTGQRLSGRDRGRPRLCRPLVSSSTCSKALSSGLPRLQVEIWAILDAAEQSTSVSRVSLWLAWQGPHSRLKWLEKHQGDLEVSSAIWRTRADEPRLCAAPILHREQKAHLCRSMTTTRCEDGSVSLRSLAALAPVV